MLYVISYVICCCYVAYIVLYACCMPLRMLFVLVLFIVFMHSGMEERLCRMPEFKPINQIKSNQIKSNQIKSLPNKLNTRFIYSSLHKQARDNSKVTLVTQFSIFNSIARFRKISVVLDSRNRPLISAGGRSNPTGWMCQTRLFYLLYCNITSLKRPKITLSLLFITCLRLIPYYIQCWG